MAAVFRAVTLGMGVAVVVLSCMGALDSEKAVTLLGIGVQAVKPTEIPAGIQKRIHKKTDALAKKIRKAAGSRGYNLRAKGWFALMRLAHKLFPPSEPDYGYWEARGWHGNARPWR